VGTLSFALDGRRVSVPDDGQSLLYALREHIGCRVVKDGCSPQGQCGCCTVWIDGAPRVSCVTPARRARDREITTTAGLPESVRERWASAFVEAGASQCGFCTPGIVMRLAALEHRRSARDRAGPDRAGPDRAGPDRDAVRSALAAHLCRCTGWQSVVEAGLAAWSAACGDPVGRGSADRGSADRGSAGTTGALDGSGEPGPVTIRDPLLSSWRAEIEGACFQTTNRASVLGELAFADDTAPDGALVAMPGTDGGLVVGATLAEAIERSARAQGRRSTVPVAHPLDLPVGEWALTLQTTWVEPAYLEPDASWCEPGGEPASPLANGGAFGGKRSSPVAEAARRLADEHRRAVRVLWTRQDVARSGPKRPPVAVAVRPDGTGVLRVVSQAGIDLSILRRRVGSVAAGLVVEPVEVLGPPVSLDARGAGWVEAAVVMAALGAMQRAGTAAARSAEIPICGVPVEMTGPTGGRARVAVGETGEVEVEVWAGEVLDEVLLRSYCIGAVHQALGWVRSESIAVDSLGEVQDLTIRSYGILPAREMPAVDVTVHAGGGWPVNASDAVFAAAAAAAWLADGLPPSWPTQRGSRGR